MYESACKQSVKLYNNFIYNNIQSIKLNFKLSNRVVKVGRVGGGFGGKEIRCLMVALPCAVAAQK
jgi:xanthine dehydrogenase molybdopterin-binding subunit B